MEESAKAKLVNDIENRLEDFFGEPTTPDPTPTAPHSLEKLKSAILSIDWEITDECLSDLINETDAQLPRFQNDPIPHALLRMLRALGSYVRKRKAQSHQDAIKRVMSVFTSLETIVQNSRMDEQRKRQIVAKEILAFKKLKEQVEVQRAKRTVSPASSQTNCQAGSDVTALLEHQGFKKAMHAVEERINTQVAALKAELAKLQQELKTLRRE